MPDRIPSWRAYQEEVAAFFRSLGYQAEVELLVQGARARHIVDVWVTFTYHGVSHRWAVECKDWTAPVPKEKVLALRELVQDVGASHGLLVSKSGFQPSAFEAATHTNIVLTTLEDLQTRSQQFMTDPVTQLLRPLRLQLGASLIADLVGPSGRMRVVAIPDSGAELNSAPYEVCANLGVRRANCKAIAIETVAGTTHALQCELGVHLELPDGRGTHRWRAPFLFVPGLRHVLFGRRGFFEEFTVSFVP